MTTLYETRIDPYVEECPFCGSLDTGFYRDDKGYHCGCFTEHCTGYLQETRAYPTEEEAIKAWNMRRGNSYDRRYPQE